MLKSKDAFVPCRNLSLGNRLSLTAMEKVAAFPLCAAFMPNSPMPMLEVSDCPLLTTVSTIVGGGCWTAPVCFSWLSLLVLPPCQLPKLIVMRLGVGLTMFVVVGEKLCRVVFLWYPWRATSSAVLNRHSLICGVYNFTSWRSGTRLPALIQTDCTDDGLTCHVRTHAQVPHAVFTIFVWLLSAARHENSSHLSIAADLFSKPSAALSVLIGKGSWCLSLLVVCVVHVCQSPFAVSCTCGRVDMLFF